MADKVFGIDFTNESNPLGAYTLSVHNGTALVDITLTDIVELFSSTTYPPFRNLLMNGAMKVSQRGTSFSGLTTTTVTLDRWRLVPTSIGTFTVSQDTDVPSGSGFRKSLKVLVTTADASPAAGDNLVLHYRWEGQHLQHIRKGTSSAKTLVLTFWVKSDTTGTFIVELNDQDNTRQISKSYTISVADTWEQKTITFAGDTSGVLDDDANNSLMLIFWMAAGSTYTSGALNTGWAGVTDANRAVGQTNLAAATSNYINITGVQLEIGSTATEFEFIPFDADLQRCSRYYQKSFPYTTTPAQNVGVVGALRFSARVAAAATNIATEPFSVPMRAVPTFTFYNPSAANAQVRDTSIGADCSATVASGAASERTCALNCTGNASTLVADTLDVHWTADAEL